MKESQGVHDFRHYQRLSRLDGLSEMESTARLLLRLYELL